MGSYQFYKEYIQEVTDDLKHNYLEILKGVGEDVDKEGILKTPERAAKAMKFLTSGAYQDPAEILRGAMLVGSYITLFCQAQYCLYT